VYDSPARKAKTTGNGLFVHQYRCMAAPDDGVAMQEVVANTGRQRRAVRE
jgi:hypothetical protein